MTLANRVGGRTCSEKRSSSSGEPIDAGVGFRSIYVLGKHQTLGSVNTGLGTTRVDLESATPQWRGSDRAFACGQVTEHRRIGLRLRCSSRLEKPILAAGEAHEAF